MVNEDSSALSWTPNKLLSEENVELVLVTGDG